jgi:CHAT domain-containing protein
MASFFWGDTTTAVLTSIDAVEEEASDIRRDTLCEIKHSGKEVALIAKGWRGKAYYGTDASAQRLRKEASNCRILHLSTHAKADDRKVDCFHLNRDVLKGLKYINTSCRKT